jgi:hypothetical protein
MKALIDILVQANQTLNILKSQLGFKNKSETITFVINYFRENELEPEFRPEFAEKIVKDESKKGLTFKSVEELRSRYA